MIGIVKGGIIKYAGRTIVRRQWNRSGSSSSSIVWKEDAYINGEWISANSSNNSSTFDVLDPATEAVIATLPDMGATETKLAIDAAQVAFDGGWKNTLAKERCEILRSVFEKHREYESELSELLALESGKPLAEAVGEIRYGASFFEWFAEEAKRTYGTVIPEPVLGRKLWSVREAVGVCGLITPWNFPNAMIARKMAPALAAGCTCVIKPSPEAPLSTLALCRLFEMAGVPPGVVNVVTSSNQSAQEVGSALTSDSRVRKLSFTGSTKVGKLLYQNSADTVKRLSMELGGDAPFVVFDDADLEKALEGLIMAKFRNSGQTCVAANRIYVQSGVYQLFSQMLTERVKTLKVGRYDEPDVAIGPLIHREALAKVSAMVKDAVANDGAIVLTGGHDLVDKKGPCFYAPTVLKDCQNDDTIQEIFGPICPLFQFNTEDELIHRANDTDKGLAAYAYTSNASRIFRLSEQLQYGMIGINTGSISSEVTPFGGIKQSGLGREGSKYGMDEYTHIKTITLQHEL